MRILSPLGVDRIDSEKRMIIRNAFGELPLWPQHSRKRDITHILASFLNRIYLT
ncbi:hypothetical protein PIB30_085419, partial [Stylosanthes scabra]|nr:hypothetical protein [Stylosanthes scabra]